MARPRYLLGLTLLAELTRPRGNRRVFTLFQQRQAHCAIPAPVISSLLRGVESLPDSGRRTQLRQFSQELLRSGPEILPFDRDAAVWLARETVRRDQLGQAWTTLQGQLAAIGAVQDLTLITRHPELYRSTPNLHTEDWFRP